MFKDLKIMKTNIITNNTNMKTYMKYLCAVLIIIGTSAHAWATTETLDFTKCWGIPETYSTGVYTYGGYAIQAHDAKYNSYTDYWVLQYLSGGDHNAWGGIILPPFDGTVSSITVTAGSGSGATPRNISLYVDGELHSTSTGIAASGSYTFTSLSIAAGSTIELRNSTSNNEFHLASLSIVHNGTQMGGPSAATHGTIAASADGNGTITIATNPIGNDQSTTMTAVPADGWSFVNWEVKIVQGKCQNWQYYQTESVTPNASSTTVTLTNSSYADEFIVIAHFEESTCSNTPVITFASDAVTKKYNAADGIYQAASITGKGSGQTLKYSSSNTSIATINQSTGSVHLTGALGSTTITASVLEDGDYCAAEDSYTLTVEGYNVTYHIKSCVSNKPSSLTNQKGSVTLATGLSLDGYQFVGWTTNGSYSDNSTPPSMEGASITVTANVDLYAVFKKTSSTFEKMPENTSGSVNTSVPEGDYVICTNYDPGSTARVFTNDVDGNYRIPTDNTEFTFTAAGLSCTNEEYVWHISGTAGNYLIYNATTDKYLGAAGGDASGSGDRKIRMLDDGSSAYAKWTISQNNGKVPYMFTNTKRNSDSETNKSLGTSSNNIFFRPDGNKGSYFLFKRVTASSNYTLNPDCDAAEYTVTIRTTDAGCTGSASASGATWSAPVLAPVLAGTSVSINSVACEGYDFTRWEVTSGGASLNSAATTASNSFDMPSANVVLTPVFTAKTYTITYKDKGDVAYSGPTPPSPATYTYGEGATLPEVTKSGYIFMGWFAETDCSGTRVNSIAADATGDKIFYAKWLQLDDYRAWCPEPEVHLTGDNVYITSTSGKSVKAVNTLTLNAINLVPGSTVRLSTPAGSGVMFSTSGVKYNATTTTVDFTADAGGDITDVPVYVHYYPTSAGTGAPADVTVTAEYQTNTDYYSTKDVHVRNMPSAFVIAAKAGGSWYALPANIASATNPASVMIDVDESSWTAKGPSTLAYELWPVKSTTGGADLYATKGEKVRFSGNSYKGLWASTSTNTLNNNAVIDAIDDTPETNYEWNVTTETDGSTWKYKLKMEGQSNFLDLHSDASGLIWGSYSANVASDELYLIPLTPIEPITMKVVEWYPTKVLVKTASDISSATVSINGTPVDKTITKKSGASCELYEISGLTTLTSNPTKTLTVSYTSGDTYSASVKIPVIIWESQNLVNPSGDPVGGYRPLNEPFASLTKEVYSYADLVVRDGATLTINGTSPQNTFYDVTIYPTSKISVPETNANAASNVFNIHSLTFFGGIDDIYDGSTYTVNKYGVPELSLKGGFGTKTVSTINYDMRVDDSQMYSLTVPYDVDLADITYWDGTSMGTLGDKLWVSAYDGQARANKDMAHTWVYEVNFESKFGEAKLKRGTGYTISADYQASMGNQTSIIRLPMKSNVAASATEVAKTVPVTAYVNTQGVTVGDNNKGWNLVGNPYMVSISGGEPGSQLVLGKLVESGTGPWDWDGKTYPYRYVTIPFDDGTDYYQMKFKDATLRPFKNFFVQIDNTTDGNALGFALASRQDAPARFLQVAEQEVEVEILLSNDTRHDNMGLLIAEKYSPAYEINADLEKMIGSMAVYTIFGGYNLAYNALSPDDAKQFIPVGYVAPTAGEYTFSLDDESDVNEIEHIFLTDYQANVTVDLMEQDYTFTTGSGKNESRFVLNTTLKEKHETPTDIDIINSGGDLNADEPFKFIYRDKMYILRNGVMYDATGKKVKTINK